MIVSFKRYVDRFFARCRKFIKIDGCHLEETFKEIILIACIRCLPFTDAIIDQHSRANWVYFFNILRGVISDGNEAWYTFMPIGVTIFFLLITYWFFFFFLN